jgi:glutathione-regulated potassium-efflux system ancillary protein KefG
MTTAQPPGHSRVLILFAHPALEKSRVNRVLVAGLSDLDGITFHDLYEAYPDFHVDVAREQALLTDHDIVVLHHPFFWYSTPALLKEWQDLVLEHGWAYGSEGKALQGKIMLSAVTSGGGADAYRPEGYSGHYVRDFLLPIAQTARLCGMTWLAPFVAHGTHRMTPAEMAGHAADYRRLLTALRDGRIDLLRAAAPDLPFVNQDLDRILMEES